MDAEFVSDGCSGPRCLWRLCNVLLFGTLGDQPPFRWACVLHDVSYWAGGTWIEKDCADHLLRKRIAAAGYPVFGFLTYWGVRLFGGPDRNTPYRWGFGHDRKWRRGYASLSIEQRYHRDREMVVQECGFGLAAWP